MSSSTSVGLRVYADLLSQPSRAVLIFLKENNIPHEVILVNIAKGQQFTEEFRKINPNRKVPVIDDSGFILWESHTILRYLATTRKVASHWYPSDPKQRAEVDRVLDWHHANLRAASSGLVFSTVLAPNLGVPADKLASRIPELQKQLKSSLRSMEGFLADKPFMAGQDISIADLSLACETAQLSMMAFDLSPYPKVVQWMQAVQNRLTNWEEVNRLLKKAAERTSKKSKL